eukprot:jgi/Tetstr1/420558/TSEL_011648.t1
MVAAYGVPEGHVIHQDDESEPQRRQALVGVPSVQGSMAAVSQFVVLMVLVSCGLAGVDAKAGSRDAQRRARQAPSGPRIPKVEVEHRLHLQRQRASSRMHLSRIADIRRHSSSHKHRSDPMPKHTSYVASSLKTDSIDWPSSCEGVQLRFNTTPDISDLMQIALLEAKSAFVVSRENVDAAWVPLRNGPLRAPGQLLPEDDSDVIREEKYKRCAVIGNSGHLLATEKYVIAAAKQLGLPNPWRSSDQGKADEPRDAAGEDSDEDEQVDLGQRRRLAEDGQSHIAPRTDRVSAATRRNNTLTYIKGMMLPLEQGAILLPMVETVSRGYEMELLNLMMQMARPDAKVRVLSLRAVHIAADLLIRWRQRMRCAGIRTSGGFRPTTGFLATFLMLSTCDHLVLFGFGGASRAGLKTPFHFYTGLQERTWATKSDNVHSFDAEWAALRSLASAGSLKFCNDASDEGCGSVWDMHNP